LFVYFGIFFVGEQRQNRVRETRASFLLQINDLSHSNQDKIAGKRISAMTEMENSRRCCYRIAIKDWLPNAPRRGKSVSLISDGS
jgi:hypothetical protein